MRTTHFCRYDDVGGKEEENHEYEALFCVRASLLKRTVEELILDLYPGKIPRRSRMFKPRLMLSLRQQESTVKDKIRQESAERVAAKEDHRSWGYIRNQPSGTRRTL